MSPQIAQVVKETIDSLDRELREISLKIHDNPELGNREFKAHDLLTDYLKKKGFKVTRHAVGLETAFIAEYSNGGQGRRVGFCSEYDALPGVGHACGHNLIAISGLACAIATKALLEQHLIEGSVVLFGTPAEETGNGKIEFVQRGEVQNRVDFAMMLHPFAMDGVYSIMLALDSLTVEFFGRASHAGMAPWEGVNALDALMESWNNYSMLRQQLLPTDRLHGIITSGGKSANVIPDYAGARFYARALTRNRLAELKVKLENCFKAGAKATGCQLKLTWAPTGPVEDVFTNDALAKCYTECIQKEGIELPPREKQENITTGSTDMGNISYVVPAIHPGFGIGTTAANHTVEFTKAAGTEEAHKNTLRAARALVNTAAAVFLDDKLFHQVVADFKKGKPQ
ncbi:hypothetical protein VTP01DRAFT_8622 [Rhizomucor pusillus]|uniref:uncharacterized protein n=1 Tax=Rhizomucor pusillus TaxID=4840 RepID=UPI00374284F9